VINVKHRESCSHSRLLTRHALKELKRKKEEQAAEGNKEVRKED